MIFIGCIGSVGLSYWIITSFGALGMFKFIPIEEQAFLLSNGRGYHIEIGSHFDLIMDVRVFTGVCLTL